MELDLRAYATTVSDGNNRFHPAVQQGLTIRYWPNIRFATEQEAYEHAGLALKDAYEAANSISRQWNMVQL